MSELVIYRGDAGTVEVRLEGDTVRLRQEHLSQLFGRDRTVIGGTCATSSRKANSIESRCIFPDRIAT